MIDTILSLAAIMGTIALVWIVVMAKLILFLAMLTILFITFGVIVLMFTGYLPGPEEEGDGNEQND